MGKKARRGKEGDGKAYTGLNKIHSKVATDF